ncbi:MAG: hypothetical protein ACON4Y_03600 [Flavobacteriales bacterium]
MNQKTISLILWPAIIILAYFVVKSPLNQISFEKDFNERKKEVIQNLIDIRSAQVAYKEKNKKYANDFNTLINFVKNDSLPIIKAVGEVPDSLTEEQALKAGIISRDSAFVSVYESVFSENYLNSRESDITFDIDQLSYVPFSDTKQRFKIEAGEIEKGKVIVQVFEVSTSYQTFMDGIDASNKGVNMNKLISVGSMTEASINGNWGE